MGVKYLWDTNSVIYFLQQKFPSAAQKYVIALFQESLPIISVITEIELLCWKTNNENDIKVLNGFVEDVIIIELEQRIKLKTAELRKSIHIKLPDAIIAATALVYGYTLLTRNVSDFNKISSLKIINPWEVT